MVDMSSSVGENFVSISVIGISYSVLPTRCGPEYLGSVGTRLRKESIEAQRDAQSGQKWQRGARGRAKEFREQPICILRTKETTALRRKPRKDGRVHIFFIEWREKEKVSVMSFYDK